MASSIQICVLHYLTTKIVVVNLCFCLYGPLSSKIDLLGKRIPLKRAFNPPTKQSSFESTIRLPRCGDMTFCVLSMANCRFFAKVSIHCWWQIFPHDDCIEEIEVKSLLMTSQLFYFVSAIHTCRCLQIVLPYNLWFFPPSLFSLYSSSLKCFVD